MKCRIAVLGQLPLRVRANSFCHCSVAFVSVCVWVCVSWWSPEKIQGASKCVRVGVRVLVVA
jgi:hypothetical protein